MSSNKKRKEIINKFTELKRRMEFHGDIAILYTTIESINWIDTPNLSKKMAISKAFKECVDVEDYDKRDREEIIEWLSRTKGGEVT